MSSSTETQATAGSKGKILVMDDDEAVRFIAGRTLRRIGFEVEFAEDGTQAIDIYRQSLEKGPPIAAVILDLSIPGRMGGKEAIGRLLELDPHVQAFVSSGSADDPIMVNCRKYGFRGAIAKPFLYEEVAAALACCHLPPQIRGNGVPRN